MSEWKPIETAPRDGTHLLLACREDSREVSMVVGWFDDQYYYDVDTLGCFVAPLSDGYIRGVHRYVGEPTHWLPLPAPPA